ncbi:hypothetical protein MPH47_13130 [Psychrobacillus psychrodurans]|uniref:FtsK/SpoIIIE domain-containing protein n=1 Tax=Psychrobacillus psychrodurans TaxID=126157 RepID=UPI001F4EBB47|nr:FtsK/SpoIIIE domain-containing protein [Psychrobacillus psychrodurans]MCK1998141.1 hypothetical protein [Psychrobacillus psychrodurans]
MKNTLKMKKYKVSYKHKLRFIEYLALSLIPFALSMALKTIQPIVNQFFKYQISDYLIFVPYFFLLPLWFWAYFTSKFSFSDAQKIKALLFDVIKTNHFYFSEKFEGNEKIYTSLKFIFYFTESKLIIDTYTHGASYTKKINDLSDLLESALSLSLLEVNSMNPQYTRYEFLLNKVEPLLINTVNDIPNISGKIILDNEKVWDYAKVPHALVAGATSSGKTYMLYNLILQFAKQGAEIFILDPKRSDLSSLVHSIPNGSEFVAYSPNQIAKILRSLNEQMNNRYEKYFSSPTAKMGVNYQYFGLRPIIIFFDEVAAFMEEDKKIAKEVDSYLKQMIMKGRQAGVFLILSTQKPSVEAISSSIRDQIGLRIGLGQLSKIGYRMTLGDEWEELPTVETGTGKGLIFIDGYNWSTPRGYDAPFLDLESLDFQNTLKTLIQIGNENYGEYE